MMGTFGLGSGAMLLSGLAMLVFWGGVIVLLVWAVQRFAGNGRPAAEDPMAILRRRLAAGEITQDQYEQARRVLQS